MDDIIFHIMLCADSNTLKRLGIINKKVYHYYCNRYFWDNKLSYDHLPIIGVRHPDGWIKSYDLLLNMREEACVLMLLTEIEKCNDNLAKDHAVGGYGTIHIRFNESQYYEDIHKSITTLMPESGV